MNVSADEQLREVLWTNERILWSGRPGRRARFNVHSVIPILFLVGWTSLVLSFAGRNYLESDHPTSDSVIPIGMAAVGLSMLALIVFIAPRHERTIAYGLTNERAIIVGGLFNLMMVSMPLEFMWTVTVRERRDFSGTLVFEDFRRQCGEDRDDTCPYEFREIDAVRHVQALISTARANLDRSHAARLAAAS
jgi:hypothetical protein